MLITNLQNVIIDKSLIREVRAVLQQYSMKSPLSYIFILPIKCL